MIPVPSSPTSVCDPLTCDSTNRRKLPTAHANERCTFCPAAGEDHSTGEPNGMGGSQVGGELVWPTKEELFREPPPPQECDICSLPMGCSANRSIEGSAAISLCHYSNSTVHGSRCCPYCRQGYTDVESEKKNVVRRAKAKKDPHSILLIASMRQYGINGFEQDEKKAFKELVESAELGSRDACCVIGHSYAEGSGVERNMNLAKYWYQIAAVRGCSTSRVELANFDLKEKDPESAVRHLMISCRLGDDDGLNLLGKLYRGGLKKKDPCVTKDQYARALRSHKEFADSMKSDSRVAAAAYSRSLKSMFSPELSSFFDENDTFDSRDDQ
ncbi:hypothetical protein THAOC_11004 [Thalassiosira oceanica]|uniref:RING-type domain-containing protein n=1 Tax=Thalassiosira oceanica TaxID=159749 RepID=K0T3D7_THAOC|nr:hypothetical protein THAOC_11004 [Thalassiosira oceanica]|eukprot:EJK67891.1 hypothetical protein THAOC_11004 [Thalassiosira oceanica]